MGSGTGLTTLYRKWDVASAHIHTHIHMWKKKVSYHSQRRVDLSLPLPSLPPSLLGEGGGRLGGGCRAGLTARPRGAGRRWKWRTDTSGALSRRTDSLVRVWWCAAVTLCSDATQALRGEVQHASGVGDRLRRSGWDVLDGEIGVGVVWCVVSCA